MSHKRIIDNIVKVSGCGSVWLEYLVWDQGVAGSNPVTPSKRKDSSLRSLFLLLEVTFIHDGILAIGKELGRNKYKDKT